jgi:hypothetical protein
LFQAVLDRFQSEDERAEIDALATWASSTYRADLEARPSRHVYVSSLPAEVRARIDRLRLSDRVLAHLRAVSPAVRIVPLPETDELYLSHYNRDLGGDEGLFARHYDGNLRAIPVGAVVRALIYLRSTGAYDVVLHSSGTHRRCETYDLLLIDFHRELHWVDGAFDPEDGDRILLKCNFLVAPERPAWVTSALWSLNVGQFYAVKTAMEYSKSPRTVSQRLVGLVCNAVRLLNNAHPALPHLAMVGASLMGILMIRALALALA